MSALLRMDGCGWGGRITKGGMGEGRACLWEVEMGGCFAVFLTKWRIPNGGGVLKYGGTRGGRGLWDFDTPKEGQSLRGGVGGVGLNPRLFSCTCFY